CNSARHRRGGKPTRLGMADEPILAAAERQADLRQLGGLAGTGFTTDDDDLMLGNGEGDVLAPGADRQGLREGNRGQGVAASYRRNTSGGFCCHGEELKLSRHYNFGMNDT